MPLIANTSKAASTAVEIEQEAVNHPSHYAGSIECIDAIKAASENMPDSFSAFCCGNAIKYIWRHSNKNKPVEDLEKAVWYLNRLINYYKEQTEEV